MHCTQCILLVLSSETDQNEARYQGRCSSQCHVELWREVAEEQSRCNSKQQVIMVTLLPYHSSTRLLPPIFHASPP